MTERGDRLFEARKALGLAQEPFAKRCGLTRLMMMALEKKGPTESTSYGTYAKLAQGFSVDAETLERYLAGQLSTEEFAAISQTRTSKLRPELSVIDAPGNVKRAGAAIKDAVEGMSRGREPIRRRRENQKGD